MHPYITTSANRPKIYVFILLLSVVIEVFCGDYVRAQIPLLSDPRFRFLDFASPSALLLFSVLFFSYDSYLWKLPKPIGSGIRDFNGSWIGYIVSRESYDGVKKKEEKFIPVYMKVNQTLRNITITFSSARGGKSSTSTGESKSHLDGIFSDAEIGARIDYIFLRDDIQGYCSLTYSQKNHRRRLSGNYYSNRMRRGHISLFKCKNFNNSYPLRPRILKSKSGRDYIGIDIRSNQISNHLMMLRSMCSGKRFDELVRCRKERDGDDYHITLVDPIEMERLSELDIKNIVSNYVWVELVGLASVEKNYRKSFFVFVDSPPCSRIRENMSLNSKDFHITIGFDGEDIHDRIKSRQSIYHFWNIGFRRIVRYR